MRYTGLLPAALALLLVLPALFPLAAWAAGDRERQVVYNGEIFDGQGYGGQFYPANEPAIYVLADVQNVLIPRITQVYWWPITQEYKADWESLNQPLTGTLEIGTRSFPLKSGWTESMCARDQSRSLCGGGVPSVMRVPSTCSDEYT